MLEEQAKKSKVENYILVNISNIVFSSLLFFLYFLHLLVLSVSYVTDMQFGSMVSVSFQNK